MASWTRRLKKKTRPLRHWLLWKTIQAIEWVICRLPMNTAVRLGGLLGRVAGRLDMADRRRAMEHLRLAFGDALDDRQRRRIVDGMFVNLGRSGAEMVLARRHGPRFLEGRFDFTGGEGYMELARLGRGVMVMTGHIDNWEVAGMAVHHFFEAPIFAVAQRQSDAMVERWILDSRSRFGIEIHKRGDDARAILKNLRQGKTLFVLVDQDTDGVGAFIPFFGRPAYTLLGPAILAVRSGVPMVIGHCTRLPDGLRHHLYCSPAVTLPADFGDPTSDTPLIMQKAIEMTRLAMVELEAVIRRHPDQWVWFHRRWKTRPAGNGSAEG